MFLCTLVLTAYNNLEISHSPPLIKSLTRCKSSNHKLTKYPLLFSFSSRYDTVWGGMWMRGANEGEDVFPWTNFGFTTYADHHFHIGMWIYAIAHYAKYNMDWAMEDGM